LSDSKKKYQSLHNIPLELNPKSKETTVVRVFESMSLAVFCFELQVEIVTQLSECVYEIKLRNAYVIWGPNPIAVVLFIEERSPSAMYLPMCFSQKKKTIYMHILLINNAY
jgi:hypothetical protein